MALSLTRNLIKPVLFNPARLKLAAEFSTSPKRSAIPPLVWLIAKPLTKLGAIIAGRGFRNWWASLPNVKRVLFKEHLKRNKYRYTIGIGSSAGVSVFYYESHVQETPITHRKRFILFSSDHLREIENLEKDQVGGKTEKTTENQKYTFKILINFWIVSQF